MAEYIEREAAKNSMCQYCRDIKPENCKHKDECNVICRLDDIPAADVRPVVVCANCEHNNHCLTQEFVDDCGKIPLDRSTFFCADGERRRNDET